MSLLSVEIHSEEFDYIIFFRQTIGKPCKVALNIEKN